MRHVPEWTWFQDFFMPKFCLFFQEPCFFFTWCDMVIMMMLLLVITYDDLTIILARAATRKRRVAPPAQRAASTAQPTRIIKSVNPCTMVVKTVVMVMIAVRLLIIRMQIQVSQFFRPSLKPVIYWGTWRVIYWSLPEVRMERLTEGILHTHKQALEFMWNIWVNFKDKVNMWPK